MLTKWFKQDFCVPEIVNDFGRATHEAAGWLLVGLLWVSGLVKMNSSLL